MTARPPRTPRFSTAATVGVTADAPAGTPTAVPAQLAPEAEPAPGPRKLRRETPVSDIASKQASIIGTNPAVDMSALVRDRPDPELDLVTVTLRIPRYVRDAMDVQAMLTRRPRQAIARDCLVAGLDRDPVRVALRKASGL